VPSFKDQLRFSLNRWSRRLFGGARKARQGPAGWDRSLILSLSRGRMPSWRQIRHLPEVLSRSDGARLQLGMLLVFIGAALIGARLYFAGTHVIPAVGGEIVEGVVGTPRSLNPLYAVSNDVDMDLTRLLFSRLFTADASGAIVTDLVESYDISPDRKTYTLKLMDGVHWHDGRPLTADDVVFTMALIQDPAWKSPLYASLKDAAAEKIDGMTLRVTLKEPFAPFLSLLTFGILPQHVWKDIAAPDAIRAEENLKPVGSGPFAFESMKRDRRGFIITYTLKRNENESRQAPFIERLTFKFFPDYGAAFEALTRREIDSLSFVPRDRRASAKEVPHVIPYTLELPQYTAVFFNQRKNELLKDKDLRRALAMAINRNRIIFDVLQGDGRPLDGPALPGYTGALTGAPPHDLEESRRILESLGWKTDSQDGIRKKSAKVEKTVGGKKTTEEVMVPLRVTLTTVDQPESLTVAKIVKEGWSAAGVDASIDAIPASDVQRTAVRPREYEALLYGQLLGLDPDPYPFWHSSQSADPGLNLALFANREADDAIEAARRATDLAAREAQTRRFREILAAEAPAAFLYGPTYTYAVSADVKGFGGGRIASPSDRFASVTSWYLKTKRAWK